MKNGRAVIFILNYSAVKFNMDLKRFFRFLSFFPGYGGKKNANFYVFRCLPQKI